MFQSADNATLSPCSATLTAPVPTSLAGWVPLVSWAIRNLGS
jgi:hypothetical protein